MGKSGAKICISLVSHLLCIAICASWYQTEGKPRKHTESHSQEALGHAWVTV